MLRIPCQGTSGLALRTYLPAGHIVFYIFITYINRIRTHRGLIKDRSLTIVVTLWFQ